tara:strand:+ start:823 stop:951 length:129 start_codon:yes stop_codon:yes gene_type:complete
MRILAHIIIFCFLPILGNILFAVMFPKTPKVVIIEKKTKGAS